MDNFAWIHIDPLHPDVGIHVVSGETPVERPAIKVTGISPEDAKERFIGKQIDWFSVDLFKNNKKIVTLDEFEGWIRHGR